MVHSTAAILATVPLKFSHNLYRNLAPKALRPTLFMYALPIDLAAEQAAELEMPYAHQFVPNRLAGWKLYFAGFPTLQGVVVVYPYTSNWDAVVMYLAKSACGVKVQFWGKGTLFRIPIFDAWLCRFGGMPVKRTNPDGIVQQAIDLFAQRKAAGPYFWLGLAPEGARKYLPGWRSGFYHTALAAQVALCLLSSWVKRSLPA